MALHELRSSVLTPQPGIVPGAAAQYAVSFSYAVKCTVVDDLEEDGSGKKQEVELSGVVQGVLSGTPLPADGGADATAAAEAQGADSTVVVGASVEAMEATRSLLMAGAQG